MTENQQHLSDLKDIKQMMDRSSRFISLSGWSGIAAGICALIGAYFAYQVIGFKHSIIEMDFRSGRTYSYGTPSTLSDLMGNRLFTIAILTLVAALFFAFLFTYLRSKRNNIPMWGTTAKRLVVNVGVPLAAGGIYLLKLIENGTYGLIAPGCLIFYGLALINGSKYTIGEVRYLGYILVALGIIGCWFIGWGLYFWALGFGVMHIVYGAVMWWKYERNE